MSRTRMLSRALLLGAFVVLASCSTDRPAPLGPDADLVGDLLGTTTNLLSATGLLKCSPLPAANATKTVGKSGGTIVVGPHSLYIPAGALDSTVTITANAPTGNVNLVKFQPEGLVFDKPATLTMSYANCSGLTLGLPKRIAHTTPDLLVILEYLLSIDHPFARRVSAQLGHFSTYAVAW